MTQSKKNTIFLSRDEFRSRCLARDNFSCVVCGDKTNIHVHHIMERRLFENGGYTVDNGASVCEKHHLACERTTISTEEIRRYAGITEVVLPPQFTRFVHGNELRFDKWGNWIGDDGFIIMGPLSRDESVSRILNEGRTAHRKYPRTVHLPWSGWMEDDDKKLETVEHFNNQEVVVTEKMDGSNTTMYFDGIHGRSLDSEHHPERDLVKALWAQKVAYQIPTDMRIVGENVYAQHTMAYENVPVFLVFGIWIHDTCLSWDDTVEWCQLLGLEMVPVLYKGTFQGHHNVDESTYGPRAEGYVVRLQRSFRAYEWETSIAKYVRPDFSPGISRHWRYRKMITNGIRREGT